jgi:NAD(P)H-hydrate repair Nnr-like enzyme with NAD(P)H-hydrate dehydratase domain
LTIASKRLSFAEMITCERICTECLLVLFLFVYGSDLAMFGPTMGAAYAACLLTRHCAKKAFEKNRRSTTTTDLIATICDVFNEIFES